MDWEDVGDQEQSGQRMLPSGQDWSTTKQSRRHNTAKNGGPSHPTLVKRKEPNDYDDDEIKENDEVDQIKCINSAQSAGPDLITPTMLKDAGNRIVASLTQLFQCPFIILFCLLYGKQAVLFLYLWINLLQTILPAWVTVKLFCKNSGQTIFKNIFHYLKDNMLLLPNNQDLFPMTLLYIH